MSKIVFSPKEIEDLIFLLEWSYEFVAKGTEIEIKKELQQSIFELQKLIKAASP